MGLTFILLQSQILNFEQDLLCKLDIDEENLFVLWQMLRIQTLQMLAVDVAHIIQQNIWRQMK